MSNDVHDVLGHVRRQAGLHGDGFHPLREVVGQGQDVSVCVERLGQRPPDVQAEPLPRRRHLPTRRASVCCSLQPLKREAATYFDQLLRIFTFGLKMNHNKMMNTLHNMSRTNKIQKMY